MLKKKKKKEKRYGSEEINNPEMYNCGLIWFNLKGRTNTRRPKFGSRNSCPRQRENSLGMNITNCLETDTRNKQRLQGKENCLARSQLKHQEVQG